MNSVSVPSPVMSHRGRRGFSLLTDLYNLFMIYYEKYIQKEKRFESNAELFRKNRRAVKSSESNGLWRLSTNSRPNNKGNTKNEIFFLRWLHSLNKMPCLIVRDIKKVALYLFTKKSYKAVGRVKVVSSFLLKFGDIPVGGDKFLPSAGLADLFAWIQPR